MNIKSILLTVAIVSTGILTGCMTSNENVSTSNTIKIIREPKYTSVEKRQIQTGKIEVVDYNSSVISPELEGYKEPKTKTRTRKTQNNYGNKVSNRVKNKVSSGVNSVQSKADNTLNRTLDHTVDRLFR